MGPKDKAAAFSSYRKGKMITSLNNSRMKHITALREKSRDRNREGVFLAEGVRMFEEAPIGRIREIYYSESFWEAGGKPARHGKAYEKLLACMEKGIPAEQVSDAVFRKASDTCSPQGILFVMEQSACSLEEMVRNAEESYGRGGEEPLFLVLEDIQDPGNLGTMIRTGEGAGVSGVIMSRGCVDIYNPKTIRSTMGSLYRVPFVYEEDLGRAIDMLKGHGIRVYAAHLEGEQYFDRVNYPGGSAFLIGNEGNGLRKEMADQADSYIKIPMKGSLESLNAAVAAALLLYQAAGCHRKEGN